MGYNKTGCSVGRTTIIDPNNFDGQNSLTNVPVSIEDLNISVVLETFKKGRTVLSAGPKTSSSENSQDVSISFLNGSNVNGKKVLTTNYTNLTTIFDNVPNNDGLGITSIDIDFNSQIAPMVNINFIDVRGSSIFQNEGNLQKGTNKYSTFFQLPYPLFELTIKGYYGKPVKYCLHLTKFNSKFNSKTGNFEITCNFIGYTYAMLSDMIIGYLKAIPYTKIGAQRYDIINTARASLNPPLLPILNLNELMIKISKINEAVEKITAENPDALLISNIESKLDILLTIENNVKALGAGLDTRTNTIEKYDYIISPRVEEKKTADLIENFKKTVLPNIELFSKDNLVGLDIEAFKIPKLDLPAKTWDGIDKKSIINSTDIGDVNLLKYMNNVNNGVSFLDDVKFDAWDLTEIYKTISIAKSGLEVNYIAAKKSLAVSIQAKIFDLIGFNPTVRNIIEVFTTAVEVFMETIYTVSVSAEEDTNNLRKTQLLPKFKTAKNSDLQTNTNIFPWPDYRESSEEGIHEAYTEKYLGAANVLPIPSDVHELRFIDDLLRAFILAQQKTEEAINNTTQTNWIPVSPVDTRLFKIEKAPYSRIKGITRDEVIRLLVIRGVTFLGYTNSNLSGKEIDTMADAEFNDILENLADDSLGTVKTSLSNLILDDFINITGNIKLDDEIRKDASLLLYDTDNELYSYIYITYFDTNNSWEGWESVLPIDGGFDEETNWPLSKNYDMIFKGDYNVFLLNGNQNYKKYNNPSGAKYFGFFSPSDFNTNQTLPATFTPTTSKFILEKLKNKIGSHSDAEAAGFNAFAGKYGIQEFENLDYGEPSLDGLPLMYVFYGDGNFDSLSANRNNRTGLGYARTTNSDTDYDFSFSFKFVTPDYILKNNKDSNEHSEFKNNRLLFNKILKGDNKIVYPYVNYIMEDNHLSNDKNWNQEHSLFGSRLYYGQDQGDKSYYTDETPEHRKLTTDRAKALLFLSTLPWNGTPFEKNEIRHLFNIRGGFVHAPKLWVAYVGALAWRNYFYSKHNTDVIRWFDTKGNKLIQQNKNISFKPPKINQEINKLYFNDSSNIYKALPLEFNYLGSQIKEFFIQEFYNFISNSWQDLKKNCEIVKDGTLVNYDTIIKKIYEIDPSDNLSITDITDNGLIINYDKYKIISPVEKRKEFFLEFNTDVTDYNPGKKITSMLMEEVIISNASYRTFITNYDNTKIAKQITVNKTYFERYFNRIIKNFAPNVVSQTAIKKEKEQEIFGTTNEDTIKLILYKTCKNTYDKWLGGTTDIDNIIFQCGSSVKRNNKDIELANHYRPGDKSRLIDSFRFVDRAFTDIGDQLYINPMPVNDYLMNSPNTSFYDAIGHLLASNNFNFIPLPTFINYNNENELKSMFEPFGNYEEAVEEGVCGPSFVCVYVGQTSKHLDFGDSNYTNDGIDFQCSENGNILDIPLDFSSSGNTYDNDVAIFSVNYSQQNQNIFKDITLDQSEFTETDESLQVTDDIASKGAENNRTIAGQNIYNVYSVRSYKAEVEMMGNAMIQPMMHFQLNNIPMFHGGYLITRVKHSIVPNHMSTTFTGVRIRYPKTKLIDGAEFYMNLIDSLKLSNTGTGGGGGASSIAPIVQVIKKNGGVNGDFAKGMITPKPIPTGVIKGKKIKYIGIEEIANPLDIKGDNLKILEEAVEPLKQMLTDWVAWMKLNTFVGINGQYASITSAYRNYETQEESKNNNPKSSATPGTSMHGWGIAVDFQFYKMDGSVISNYNKSSEPNIAEGFDYDTNSSLPWLLDHSYQYGFIIPEGLRNKYNVEEFWHFEYHGKSALCILKNSPLIYGHLCDLTNPILPIVKNPKNPDGVESDLTNCSYIYVGNGDGIPMSSHLSNGDLALNQLNVKKLLKNSGLTKLQAAAVMGNIQQESKFDPNAHSGIDINGSPNYGLIQFNQAYQDRTIAKVGTTVESQINFMFGMSEYKKWLKEVKKDPTLDVEHLTYLFAKIVEICFECNKTYEIYVNNADQFKRTKYAIDIHNRFNNTNDKLAW